VRALLDTHTFLWWNLDDPQLSSAARAFIADGNNTIYLSAVVAWEIAIKAARGRLSLPEPADRYVTERLRLHHFAALPIEVSHALEVALLPPLHNDPFDRLLVAQARLEKAPILTADATIGRYGVEVVW
jgi:PIN domain nuclease of toxin-antitoxin system